MDDNKLREIDAQIRREMDSDYECLSLEYNERRIEYARDERVRAKALADVAVEFHRIKRQHDAWVRTDALEDHADIVSKAMRRAWQLGQTYWQQADSESYSQNAKSRVTQEKFMALVEETRAGIMADTIEKEQGKPPCGCRLGECESKPNHRCRMADEIENENGNG